MKFFIGGTGACDVHNEKSILINNIIQSGHEVSEYIDDADYIILTDLCIGTYNSFLVNMEYLKKILMYKDKTTKVILSGCLSKGVNFELSEEQKYILSMVTIIKPDELLNYVAKILNLEITDESLDIFLPFSQNYRTIRTSIVDGCLNNCSFCKTCYMNFNLKSVPFEMIEKFVNTINQIDVPLYYQQIISSNLSLYGVDLYKKQRAHEAINLLSKVDTTKFMNLGAIINWYPKLVDEIINNPKIKTITTSLESGSPRIYNLMNRPIELNKLIEIIKIIRKERPDIIINSEFICGFPTETIDDMKTTLSLVEELGINPQFIWPYTNSPQIASNKFPQHSPEYCEYLKKYAENKMQKIKDNFAKRILNDEKIVAEVLDDDKLYVTILKDSSVKLYGINQFEKTYRDGDIIPANTKILK